MRTHDDGTRTRARSGSPSPTGHRARRSSEPAGDTRTARRADRFRVGG
jgi:hypothetical protein